MKICSLTTVLIELNEGQGLAQMKRLRSIVRFLVWSKRTVTVLNTSAVESN